MIESRSGAEGGFQKAAALLAYERARFAAEIAFARELLARTPAREAEWVPLIEEAERLVCDAAGRGDVERTGAAVREAEGLMAPIGEVARGFTVYCVGHAHIDMNWMWSWPETVSVTIDTMTTVLGLLDRVPRFVFSQSQASIYALLERHRPDLLERVKARVAEGRWEVTASHWVETDKNMVSGESLCRHLLMTRRAMARLFGLEPEEVPIDWSPDTFGHAATVPTYLAQGGVRFVYMHRPGAHGRSSWPRAFWWAGPDGSRVLVRNDMGLGYNGVIGPAVVSRSLVPFWRESGLPFAMFVYGVGDHGGGPTLRDLARILDMGSWPVYPRLAFATAREFFERLEREGSPLPVLEGELNFEFTGCYTSQSLIKKANRSAERLLAGAEAASVLAERIASVPYPASSLEQAWRDTLFNHFHDILPGSGVRDTRTFAHGLYQQAAAAAASAETRALRALAALVDTGGAGPAAEERPGAPVPTGLGSGAGYGSADGEASSYSASEGRGVHPFVVFNMTEVDRGEVVEAEVWDPGWGWEAPEAIGFEVERPDGSRVAAQSLESGAYWGHRFQRIAFPLEVAGLGYSRCIVHERSRSAVDAQSEAPAGPQEAGEAGAWQTGFTHACSYAVYERGPEGLENETLSLALDPRGGGIARLVHRPSGVVLIEGAASLLELAVERPRRMSAWEIEHAGEPIRPAVTKIERLSSGPYVAALAVSMRIAESEARLVYELRAGDPRLHLRLDLTWLERGGKDRGTPTLRLVLPLAFAASAARAFYEIPFAAIERSMEHGEEVPALRWAAVEAAAAERRLTCALFNDSKHGHSFAGGTLALTLVRSSFEPDPLPEIGRHEVRCALRCFDGALDAAVLAREASAFERRLRVVSTDLHSGSLPAAARLVRVDGGVLCGLKRAEEGGALVLRLANPGAVAQEARVRLSEALGRPAVAEEVDLLERPLAPAALEGNEAKVRLPPRGLRSLRIAW